MDRLDGDPRIPRPLVSGLRDRRATASCAALALLAPLVEPSIQVLARMRSLMGSAFDHSAISPDNFRFYLRALRRVKPFSRESVPYRGSIAAGA